MIGSQVQYSRQQCLVIIRITKAGNESDDEKLILFRLKKETRIDEDVIRQNIDKSHSTSQPEDGKQRRIVKFTSDSFKKRVFMNHKQRKKAYIKKQKKQINQCQSGSTFNPHSPNAGWNCCNMRKKYWQLWLNLKQRKIMGTVNYEGISYEEY